MTVRAADSTQCSTWQTGDQSAEVRCYNSAGALIECCGHGLLSCAALWTAQWNDQGTLIMGGSYIPCHVSDGNVWLGFARTVTEHCSTEGWKQAVLGGEPVDCATAGDASGYLVVQMPSDTPLDSIAPPGAALAEHTQRALIVTCAVSSQAGPYQETIRFRYFAPQYGQPEDTATGSAMRILAGYWQARGLGPALTALQCSPAGGLLRSHLRDGLTWVGGRVTEDAASNG